MINSIQSMLVISAADNILADPLTVAGQIGKRGLGLLIPASLPPASKETAPAADDYVGQITHAAADR